MKVYALWNGDTCESEYFMNKDSAYAKGKMLLEELLIKFAVPEKEYEEIYERFSNENDAYHYKDIYGREVKVELAAIDEIYVQE